VARLTDAEGPVRFHAAYALGRIRDTRQEVLTALGEAMHADESHLAAFAAQMLYRIDPSIPVVPRLTRLLSAEDDRARRRAIIALIAVASQQSPTTAAENDATTAVPRLKELFHDPDLETRKQAMVAVARIAPLAEAHAALGRIVKAGPGDDRDLWTFASVLWNRLDRQVSAGADSSAPASPW
jgi:HEAT repeat protein